MVREDKTIRRVQIGAICALALVYVLGLSASAQDNSRKANSSTSVGKKASSRTHTTGTSSSRAKKTSKSSSKRSRKKSSRLRGQQNIDSDRAQAIQEALIREHYLTGEPTGAWNQASEDAMRKYQADHGWQSKTVPDSRALISLGLGPSKDHLLNPESAMTTLPETPKSDALAPTSHSAPATASPASPTSSTPATTNSSPGSDPSGPQ